MKLPMVDLPPQAQVRVLAKGLRALERAKAAPWLRVVYAVDRFLVPAGAVALGAAQLVVAVQIAFGL